MNKQAGSTDKPLVSMEEQKKTDRFVQSLSRHSAYEFTHISAPKQQKDDQDDENEEEEEEDLWEYIWQNRYVSDLIQQLEERRDNVFVVIELLGNSGDERAVKPLLKLTKDDDDDLRMAALEALFELGYPQYEPKEKRSKSDQKRQSEKPKTGRSQSVEQQSAGYSIPKPPDAKKAFLLDKASIQQKIKETAEVSQLLGSIFEQEEMAGVAVVKSEPVASTSTTFKNLDNAQFVFVKMLAKRRFWSKAEVESIAVALGLLASGTLEHLNEIALEAGDELVFEGDDPIEVNIELVEELLI